MIIEQTNSPNVSSTPGVEDVNKSAYSPTHKALISLLLNGLKKSIKQMQAAQKKEQKELKKSMKDR